MLQKLILWGKTWQVGAQQRQEKQIRSLNLTRASWTLCSSWAEERLSSDQPLYPECGLVLA